MNDEMSEQFTTMREGFAQWLIAFVNDTIRLLGELIGRIWQDPTSAAIVAATPIVALMLVMVTWSQLNRRAARRDAGDEVEEQPMSAYELTVDDSEDRSS
jgi:hypothetical protein